MPIYTYDVEENGPIEITVSSDDFEDVAADAAEDWYSNHDGCESSWPVDIKVTNEAGETWTGIVELEWSSNFTAWEKS